MGGHFNCQTCSVLSNTLHAIATLSIEPFVYLVSVLLDLGMSL